MRRKMILSITAGLLLTTIFILHDRAQTARISPASKPMIIKCGRLIDPGSERIQDAVFVETAAGRIQRILPLAKFHATIDPSVEVLDFSDKTVIPGLIDTHAHLWGGITQRHSTYELQAPLFLACGVTCIRSPGSANPEGELALSRRISSGAAIGPRIYVSSAYLEGDPPTNDWMSGLRTPEEVRLSVDLWAQKGVHSIKLYAGMKEGLMNTAIDQAHRYGLKAIMHSGEAGYEEAIRAGIDELFHGIMVMSDILPKNISQRQYLEWFEAVKALDISRPEIKNIIKLASDYRVVLTPTLAASEEMDFESEFMQSQKKYYEPKAWDTLVERAKNPFLKGKDVITGLNLKFVAMAYEAGCILTTGTDKTNIVPLPGYSLWQEMDAFARAGLPPMAVLKAATRNGAYALGCGDSLGAIEPGMWADLVILENDPLEDIHNVRHVHRVIKAGRIYDPEDLTKRLVGRFN